MWRTREDIRSLSTNEKLAAIRNGARLSPRLRVSISGGETMRKSDEFFAIGRLCRSLSLACTATTNGTLADDESIDRLVEDGPTDLFVSLDSHHPHVHDWIRGVPGTFELAVDAVRRLVERSQAFSKSPVRLFTNTILFDVNLPEIEQTARFLQRLGVDGMSFQVLSPTFMLVGKRDVFFHRHFPCDLLFFDASLDRIRALKCEGVPILTSDIDLRWMRMYVRDPGFLVEPVCASGERNIIVEQNGDVLLCHSMRTINGGLAIGNIRRNRLDDLLGSDSSDRLRGVMRRCRLNCGMLNCHRKRSEADSHLEA